VDDVVAEALSQRVRRIDVVDVDREHRVLAGRGVAADQADLRGRVARRPGTGDPAEVEGLLGAKEFGIELVAGGGVGDIQIRNDPLDHHEPIVAAGACLGYSRVRQARLAGRPFGSWAEELLAVAAAE
jgi:hypothetical protein